MSERIIDALFDALNALLAVPRDVRWRLSDTHRWGRGRIAGTRILRCDRCGSSCVGSGRRPSAREAVAFGILPDCDQQAVKSVIRS